MPFWKTYVPFISTWLVVELAEPNVFFLKSRQRCPVRPEVRFFHRLALIHNNVPASPVGALEWQQVIISGHPSMIPRLKRGVQRTASKQVMEVSLSGLCLSYTHHFKQSDHQMPLQPTADLCSRNFASKVELGTLKSYLRYSFKIMCNIVTLLEFTVLAH